MYRADDRRMTATMAALREKLWIGAGVGGMARYENENYHRVKPEVTGNPWIISTLWLADYHIATASGREDLKKVEEVLRWVCDHTLPSGAMAEQINPDTGAPLSVSPLTWSHGAFVSTCQRYQVRIAEMDSVGSRPRQDDWIGKLFTATCDMIHGACKVR